MARLQARGPNLPWSWDITYQPTSVSGVWLFLHVVIDVWSSKVVAWDVVDRDDFQIASDLVGRACQRERINRRRRQPLVLHADNGNATRAATFEARLEELGVVRSSSRTRVSNDNPYSELLFRSSSTGRTTPIDRSAGRTTLASGWRQVWTGTTTNTATVPSSL